MEDKERKIYDFIKGNIINFIVILTGLVYIFYGMLKIEKTGLTPSQVIAQAGIGVIVGLMIKQGIGENGFSKGYNSYIWKENFEKYNNACNLANDHIEKVDNFYQYEEIEKKRTYRRATLMGVRLKYNMFFDENGDFIATDETLKKLDKKQLRVVNKCVKVKIYNLNLFSEYSTGIITDTRREKTDKDQRSKMFGKNSTAQVLTAIAGAYFTALWNDWNAGSIILHTIQICIWTFCGVLQLYTNFNYVVVEKVNKLKRKIELIIKFKRGCDNGLYKHSPYDEITEDDRKEEAKDE